MCLWIFDYTQILRKDKFYFYFFFMKGQCLLKIRQRRFLQCEPVDIHGRFYEKNKIEEGILFFSSHFFQFVEFCLNKYLSGSKMQRLETKHSS